MARLGKVLNTMLFIETRAEIITYIVYVQFLPMLVNTPNLGAIYYLCDISKGKHMINLIDYFFPVHIFHRHLYSQKITWFKCYISTLYKMYHECVHNKFLVYSNLHKVFIIQNEIMLSWYKRFRVMISKVL